MKVSVRARYRNQNEALIIDFLKINVIVAKQRHLSVKYQYWRSGL